LAGNTTTIEVGLRDLADLADLSVGRAAVVIFAPHGTEVVEVSASDEVVLGRSQTADFCVDDASLSRHHARFGWRGDRFFVEDLSSRNGTWIGGKKITQVYLSSGETIQLGSVPVVVAVMDRSEIKELQIEALVPRREGIIVRNSEMRAIYKNVAQAAMIDASVLITGETGTGKEHVALSLHELSDRRNKPFKVVNCAAIPPQITESILFGHERGAFTGAIDRSIGLFEQANGGVLFLDEVGELSSSIQAGLLRAVEHKKITRIGSPKEIAVDVRVIAATHCDLDAMVSDGTFRQDLLYRLNTITFELPPLRNRRDEIEPMANLFLQRASESWKRPVKRIDQQAIEKLKQYEWPGNIRQLRNVVERAVICCTSDAVTLNELPPYIAGTQRSAVKTQPLLVKADDDSTVSYKERLRLWEIEAIRVAMQQSAGNQRAAARLLAIPRSTLSYKLEAYGLASEQWGAQDNDASSE
jgi:two-component system response regulator AtoC